MTIFIFLATYIDESDSRSSYEIYNYVGNISLKFLSVKISQMSDDRRFAISCVPTSR